MSVSPARARSNSFVARSRAAVGREEGDCGCDCCSDFDVRLGDWGACDEMSGLEFMLCELSGEWK